MRGDSGEYKKVMRKLREVGGGEFAIEEAVKNLHKEDCYNDWQEELRYFMYRYEEHLAEGEEPEIRERAVESHLD